MKVFWSWQSDTPGKTGRFFVRDCLLEAINRIKRSDELVEPTERETRDALHLDSDRQGVAGSPDLADLILKKIDESEVLVADVTPVSRIAGKRLADGARSPPKRNMNPNVAIELGYALKSRGTEKVLMVLNEHYGKRQHLPFDLAHKAGPLLYNLKPDAIKEEIELEKQKLVEQLTNALRPYVEKVFVKATPKRTEIPSTFAPFAYFEPSTPLAEVGERGEDEIVDYGYRDTRAFYLRVISETPPALPFSRAALRDAISAAGLSGLDRDGPSFFRVNQFGAIAFDIASQANGLLSCSTQIFQNGEIWGINREFIADRSGRLVVPSEAIEQVYRKSLPEYVRFAQEHLRLNYPFRVVGGATGLNGAELAVRSYGGSDYVRFLTNSFETSKTLQSDKDQTSFLISLFQEMWDDCGLRRPIQVAGFPPEIA